MIFVGERGILMHETYGKNPRIWPAEVMAEAERVPETLPRVPDSHEMNWVRACKGEVEATTPFSYAAPLTEVMLLGIAALRAGQGRKLYYDAEAMAFTGASDADQYLTREYREGWRL